MHLYVCLALVMPFYLPSTAAVDYECLFPTQMSGPVNLRVDRSLVLLGYRFEALYSAHLVYLYSDWQGNVDSYLQDLENGVMFVFPKDTQQCKKVPLSDEWKFPRFVPTGLRKYFNEYLDGVANVTTYLGQDPRPYSVYDVTMDGTTCTPSNAEDVRQVDDGRTRTYSFHSDTRSTGGHDLISLHGNTATCIDAEFPW